MAKDFGLSCPLCLTANDPADMLGVVIEHAVPVPSALIGLCKRCVVAIVKSAMATELITPEEVFGDASAAAEPPATPSSEEASNAGLDGLDEPSAAAESDSSSAPAEAAGALVLQDPPAEEEHKRPPRRVRRHAE